MKAEDLVKYIFSEERVDYELHTLCSRKRELVQAKQRSQYLLHYFYPELTLQVLAEMFNQNTHANVLNSFKSVSNQIATDKKYENEISRYITIIRGKMNNSLKVNCVSVEYKMENKRAIIRQTSQGFEIKLKRLNRLSGFRDQVESTTLNISEEALEGIFAGYKILKDKC